MQPDHRRRARQQVADDTASTDDSISDAENTTASGAANQQTNSGRSGTDTVAVALERLIWTIMSLFSLLLAVGAAALAVRADGPAAVGLALAAIVVAVSAAYFLYHMWRSPEDAQEF